MLGMDSGDTATVIVLLAAMIFVLALRALGNRRQVTRHVLHGQPAYTIRGYTGPDARGIVEEIHKAEPDAVITPEDVDRDELDGGKTQRASWDGPPCGESTCTRRHGDLGRHI